MSDQKKVLSPPQLPDLRANRLIDLDLSPEEYAAVSLALEVAGDRAINPDGEDYHLLSKLFRLMAIVAIFQEQMNTQAMVQAEKDLAALGLNNVFKPSSY